MTVVALPHRVSFELLPTPPYDTMLTLDKPSGYWNVFTPDECVGGDVLWSALSHQATPVGVRAESKGEVDAPRVGIDIYRQAPLSQGDRSRIEETLATKLTPDIDLGTFYDMAEDDPILEHPVNRLRGMQLTTGDCLFSRALLAITLQQASIHRSQRMRRCLIGRYGTRVRFDGRTVSTYPDPSTMIKVTKPRLRNDCGVGYRASYIKNTAAKIGDGFMELETLSKLPLEDARDVLQKLSGIGEYSADVVNPYRGCPIDSWSAEVFGRLLLDDDKASVREVKTAAEIRWGKWAWLAFAYVVQNLEGLSDELGVTLRSE